MPEGIINKGLGWLPDLPDVRDEKYAFKTALRHELKAAVPVRTIVPWKFTKTVRKSIIDCLPIKDQTQSSSCTGQSVGSLIDQMSGWIPRSSLQLYWQGRAAIGETRRDEGAYIRDVVKSSADLGAGSESLWPFSMSRVLEEPSRTVMYSAARHKIKSYHRLQTREDFQSCLAEGFAFVIGFTCYADFVTAGGYVDEYGILLYPQGDQSNYGGHAVTVIGYDNDFRSNAWAKPAISAGLPVPSSVYIVRNSWGPNWGNKGHFAVDAAYFENPNLADDAWTVRII